MHIARVAGLLSAALLIIARPGPAQEPVARRLARVSLRLVDEDGAPHAGASVMLLPTEAEMVAARERGELGVVVSNEATDANGRADLVVAAGEARSVRLSCPDRDGVEVLVHELPVLDGGEFEELELTLRTRDDTALRLRVVDAVTGEGLPGVAVVAGEPWVLSGRRRGLEVVDLGATSATRTDLEGRVTLRAASWRRRIDTLLLQGYAVRRLMVGGLPDASALGEGAEEIVVRLERAAPLHITLVDPPEGLGLRWFVSGDILHDGSVSGPALDGEIALAGERIDEEDRWLIRGVPPGVVGDIVVSRLGTEIRRLEEHPAGQPGTETRVTLELSKKGRVIGQLLTPDDRPVGGAPVVLVRPRYRGLDAIHIFDDPLRTVRTDGSGRFAFEGLMADRYLVGVMPETELPEVDGAPGLVVSQVASPSGDAWTVRSILRLVPGRYVAGRIEFPDGSRPDAYVQAVANGWGGSYATTRLESTLATDPPGSFRLGPFPTGTVSVFAGANGRSLLRDAHGSFEAGANDAILTMELGCAIEGEVEMLHPGTHVCVAHGRSGFTSSAVHDDGTFRLTGLATGEELTVFQRVPGGQIGEPLHVTARPGETLSGLVLPPLQEAAILRVRVTGDLPVSELRASMDSGIRVHGRREPTAPGVHSLYTASGSATVEALFDGKVIGTLRVPAKRGETVEAELELAAKPEEPR